jgi:hypothetical protein
LGAASCAPTKNGDPKKSFAEALISAGLGPYHSVVTPFPLPMISYLHTPQADRPTTEALCVSMRSDRRTAISTVNFGWKFTLGSGVT